MPKRPDIDWSKVDFSKGCYALAKELGMARTSVAYQRDKAGAKAQPRGVRVTPGLYGGRASVLDGKVIDWARKTNSLIAEEFGITPNAVFVYRKNHNLPPSPGVRFYGGYNKANKNVMAAYDKEPEWNTEPECEHCGRVYCDCESKY